MSSSKVVWRSVSRWGRGVVFQQKYRHRRHPCDRFAAGSIEGRVYGGSTAATLTTNWHCFRLYSSSDDATVVAGDETIDKKRIVFLGTPEVAATSFTRLVEEAKKETSPYEVVAVITQPPKRRGRRAKSTASPVGAAAEELGVPVLCPEKAKDKAFLDELEYEIRPDLCITAAYGQYLPKRFLAIPKYGTINIHPSLLPRWRGASPVQRSLQAGDNPVGVSILYTVSRMDAGPIISQRTVPISDDDAASHVLSLLFDIGTDCLLQELPQVFEGEMSFEMATPQDDDEAVAAGLIKSEEGELKVWKEGARECHNKVRGFEMWPGTSMMFRIGDDDEDAVVKVKIIETRVAGEEGSVSESDLTNVVKMGKEKKSGLMVVCGDGSILELLRVQPVTRKAMDVKSFVNGLQGKTLRWIKTAEEEENMNSQGDADEVKSYNNSNEWLNA
eukprot:CAMPEP_0172486644 /NCGR_PEP_ID=MMETSP1066-20121228/15281_1 /TAXON_ID=671091 /ORGANISM="Coscinodiscus wailesii, Strain CCMP2513" /LENGTH=443 /DNA_ID=CAMNT_0013252715 /DNA_START=242 /DNA_END=1570 /DNA_ORIENTATION=-